MARVKRSSRPPWTVKGTHYFYGGVFSNFEGTPGLMLPECWFGRKGRVRLVEVPTVEHWFQASKATCRADFYWVLSASRARETMSSGD